MRKMIEMDCCDCCGEPFYCRPEDICVWDVVNGNGEIEELTICEECLDERQLYTTCDFCGHYIKIENCFCLNGNEYCPACTERAIEELEDNVREAKRQLADAKEIFRKRKNEIKGE